MAELTIRLINVHSNFYIAVDDSHYKLLKVMKKLTYKDNVVVKSEIDRMLANKEKIKMSREQWESFYGHVFFTDGHDDITHKELRDRVSMGAFIHHKAKTGARNGLKKNDKRTREQPTEVSSIEEANKINNLKGSMKNEIHANENRRKIKIAVGAASGWYVLNIFMYLGSLALSTSIYLNTQTGSLDENFQSALNAKEGMVALANCVKTGTMPSGLASETLYEIQNMLFITPGNYVTEGENHMLEWFNVGVQQNSLHKVVNTLPVPEKYIDIADDLAKFRGMPFEEIVHWLKLDNVPYAMDDDYATDMNFSAETIFSRFGTEQDFIEGVGKSGTDYQWGELTNGRSMHRLFSYSKVWNDFSIEHFVSKCANTFSNLLTGGEEDSFFGGDDPANIEIRRQIIITFGIMAMFSFHGILHVRKLINNYRLSDETKKKQHDNNVINDPYYDMRRKTTHAEGLLDLVEVIQVGFLLMTATVEFIGITNIVGTNKKMDTFVSDAYSSNWYYMSALGVVSAQPKLRSMIGTTTRHNDGFNTAMVADTVMNILIWSISQDPTQMLHQLIGSDPGSANAELSRMLLQGYLAKKLLVFLYDLKKSHYDSPTHALTGAIITLHANMLKDGEMNNARVLRNRLIHNKEFRRVVMTQLCAI